MSLKEIALQSTCIELKRDKNGKTYFLICNRDTGLAYFAFSHQVKRGWHDLEVKWTKAKEIWIKHEKQKVIALKILKTYEELLIIKESM